MIDLSEKRIKEHLMQEVALRRKEQVPSIHRAAEKAHSRKLPVAKSMPDHADEITLAVYIAHIHPYCGVYNTCITWIRSKLLRLTTDPEPLGTTPQVLRNRCSVENLDQT